MFDINLESTVILNSLLSLITIIISYVLAMSIIKLINNNIKDAKKRHKSRTWVFYTFIGITMIAIIIIWFKEDLSLTTFFGFLSAGLALSLHQVLINIVGWLVIIFQKPFSLGDRIEFSGIKGDVIDINMFFTTLFEVGNWVDGNQSTGRVVHIPNGDIFKNQQFNYTAGFDGLWNESSFLVTFTSDWEEAEKIILDIANQEKEEGLEDRVKNDMLHMGKSYMVKLGKLTPITYINVEKSGVEITLRYMSSVRKERLVKNNINRKVLRKFLSDPSIEIAYPTRKVFREEINNINKK